MFGTDGGQAFFNGAIGFHFNNAIANHPGQDVAIFYDSAGDDQFFGALGLALMLARNADGSLAEYDTAAGFAQVDAFSFVGGYDTAAVDPSAPGYAVYAFDGQYGYHAA